MMSNYKNTTLWAHSIGNVDADQFAESRERLRSTYNEFWNRTVRLVAQIQADFPDLTLHDEAHLSALWSRAGLLLGDSTLNPLEAFVLGGSILIHDSGHAIKTFPGGRAEMEASAEYKDALIGELRRTLKRHLLTNADVDAASNETKRKALFHAIRKLHAARAERLATQEINGQFLIIDEEIRVFVGPIIGKIAASHHWDRDSLQTRLPKTQGAPGFLPSDWGYSPTRIGLLLRCADAIQIDQTRTPLFAFALHNPAGVSRLHWTAQQLGQPQVTITGSKAEIVFTSLNDFKEEDADAWWIAYDLIKTADEELYGCSRLLDDMRLATFVADRVTGGGDPAKLNEFIRTDGWRPIHAEVKVTKAQRIIEMFGGAQLYGANLKVPLRELIQNATDAITVRKNISNEDRFLGSIKVAVQRLCDELWLSVSDNGLGMSETVLSGALIEFGKSFWSSEDAQTEYPGMVGLNLPLIGQFGIGFFSTLMISNNIIVRSKRYDAAHDQARQLTFRNGLHARPLVSRIDGALLKGYSTEVLVRVDEAKIEELLSVHMERTTSSVKVSLSELLSVICAGINIDVDFEDETGSKGRAHAATWASDEPLEWGRRINYSKHRGHVVEDVMKLAAPLLSIVENETSKIIGRACLNFSAHHIGLPLVGGLADGRGSTDMYGRSRQFIGVLEHSANGPRREAGNIIDSNAIAKWASGQAANFSGSKLPNESKYCAAVSAASLGGDPYPIAFVLLKREIVSVQVVIELLIEGHSVFSPAERDTGGAIKMTTLSYSVDGHYSIGLSYKEIGFSAQTIEPWNATLDTGTPYHIIFDRNGNKAALSLFKCIEHGLRERGFLLSLESVTDFAVGLYQGRSSDREGLASGTSLKASGYKLTAEKIAT